MMKCGKKLDVPHSTKGAAHVQKDKLNAVRCRSGATLVFALSFAVHLTKRRVTPLIRLLNQKAVRPLLKVAAHVRKEMSNAMPFQKLVSQATALHYAARNRLALTGALTLQHLVLLGMKNAQLASPSMF